VTQSDLFFKLLYLNMFFGVQLHQKAEENAMLMAQRGCARAEGTCRHA
jgi:hypothetical protein